MMLSEEYEIDEKEFWRRSYTIKHVKTQLQLLVFLMLWKLLALKYMNITHVEFFNSTVQ